MLKDYMLTLREKEEEKYRERVSSQLVDSIGTGNHLTWLYRGGWIRGYLI
jgi:hypothetical protein